ncbi:MAG: hypothetical protein AAF564_03590 [Bacteroidota bacterium]
MKRVANFAKSLFVITLFAGSTMLFGCNAAELAGPEAPQTQNDCENECSNGRNL